MTPRAAVQRAVWLDVEIGCHGCAQSVHVAGPELRAVCSNCGTAAELGAPAWVALLREIDERSFPLQASSSETFESEQVTAAGKLGAHWRATPLACANCRSDLDLVEPGTSEPAVCKACGARNDTTPAPAWLRSELPTAMQVYNARAARSGFWLSFQGTPPALNEQRQKSIEAAMGPVSVAYSPPVSVAQQPPRRRWEWYAVAVCVVVIAVAVRQCSAKVGGSTPPEDDNAVEPSH